MGNDIAGVMASPAKSGVFTNIIEYVLETSASRVERDKTKEMADAHEPGIPPIHNIGKSKHHIVSSIKSPVHRSADGIKSVILSPFPKEFALDRKDQFPQGEFGCHSAGINSGSAVFHARFLE